MLGCDIEVELSPKVLTKITNSTTGTKKEHGDWIIKRPCHKTENLNKIRLSASCPNVLIQNVPFWGCLQMFLLEKLIQF
jgi:hypothetical protein